jgi:hypothetical protein
VFGRNAFLGAAASGYSAFGFHGPHSYHGMRSHAMQNGAKRRQAR